jgi:hypothetical protein
MSAASGSECLAVGRITEGPTTSLVGQTIQFVANELTAWRDDPERPYEEAEERLNAQLCKFLNAVAGDRFPMVLFSHEEKQTGSRRVDLAANPRTSMIIGQRYHSIYAPFVVFEGKRLPAPSKDREREYVTGGSNRSGGIQRFKLGLHGALQQDAAILGYIQAGALSSWFQKVNQWISDEASAPSSEGEEWSLDEQLHDYLEDPVSRWGRSASHHARQNSQSDRILIRHLWVAM